MSKLMWYALVGSIIICWVVTVAVTAMVIVTVLKLYLLLNSLLLVAGV